MNDMKEIAKHKDRKYRMIEKSKQGDKSDNMQTYQIQN